MATKAFDKKWLYRQLDRDHRRKAREKLRELKVQIRQARAQRREAIKNAKERCRTERLAARERARALRIRGLAELREAVRLERQAARDACTLDKTEARKLDEVERRRAEFTAERKYQAEMRRIDRSHKQRRKEHRHATYIERRGESDDEVASNIPKDMLSLWQRVRRGIKATPRMSRTEAFMKYAEEHPEEVVLSLEDKTEALIRELEAKHREEERRARMGLRASTPRYTPEELAAVPF